jgi:hypothetical protein
MLLLDMSPVSQAAVNYVHDQLRAGIKPDAIRKAMKTAGWKDADIDVAMATAMMPEMPELPSKPAAQARAGPARAERPEKISYDREVYRGAIAIGRLLPTENMKDIEKTLDELIWIADRLDLNKLSGLAETLRLTVKGTDLKNARKELSRVGPKIRQVFEEELGKAGRGKKRKRAGKSKGKRKK